MGRTLLRLETGADEQVRSIFDVVRDYTYALNAQGCERIFQEKFAGIRKDRPELLRMMDMLRQGDTIIICELTRLRRSVKDLFDLVKQIEKAGANIRSLKEPWLDTTTPQ